MPLPTFTADEQYLLHMLKSQRTGQNPFLWAYLIAGAFLGGAGAYQENVLLMLVAFFFLYGFRIYEELWQSKWTPVWRSIIDKYGAAAAASNTDPGA